MRVFSIKFHRMLALIGGLALLIWGASGLLHPIMVTWGPQQAVFYPPQHPVNLTGIHPLSATLSNANIHKANAVRIIPTDGQNVLQVTIDPNIPRRYFELNSGQELADFDVKHAQFLARHYTNAVEEIWSTEWIETFTPEYPSINRLLPVYKVTFDRADNLSIFIYTETNAAAGVNNNFKTTVQTAFSWLHTWSWFPTKANWARVLLVTFFVGSLFAMGVTGIGMLLFIKRKTRAPGIRGWHRLSGYILALPILGYSASGLFHLLTYAAIPATKNLQLSEAINLQDYAYPIHDQWEEISRGLNISTVSIVSDENGTLLYRLGLTKPREDGPTTASEIRNARFEGIERTGPALYLNASTGAPIEQGDKEIALRLGEKFTGMKPEALIGSKLITRFSPEYDFRNKRLPVWQLDYGEPINATIFVDTTSGVLADVVSNASKPERMSFSFIHKLNIFRMLGPKAPNLVASILMVFCLIFLATLGIKMDLKRRMRAQKPLS